MKICRTVWTRVIGLAALAGSVLASLGSTVVLQWDPSPDTTVSGYKVYVSAVAGPTNVFAVSATNVVTVPALQAGSAYTFFVTAVTPDGVESDPSNLVTYTAPAEVAVLPPAVGFIPDQFVPLGSSLAVSVKAFDLNNPAQPLTFSLVGPAGATVNTSTGMISWTPTIDQTPSTNQFAVIVKSGTTAAVTTRAFKVVVASRGAFYALQIGGFSNGRVEHAPRGIMSSAGEEYVAGASVNLIATPAPGYELTGWIIDGQLVAGNSLVLPMSKSTLATPVFQSSELVKTAAVVDQISLAMGLVNGVPNVVVGGELGAWVLEGSSNLTDWIPVAEGLTSDQLAGAATGSLAFYRVHSRPLDPIAQ